jgi:hypothetical protein
LPVNTARANELPLKIVHIIHAMHALQNLYDISKWPSLHEWSTDKKLAVILAVSCYQADDFGPLCAPSVADDET